MKRDAMQGELFEPTGREVARLALSHQARGDALRKQAELARTLGFGAVADRFAREAAEQYEEAEVLAMLADFEQLGGIA